MCYEAFVGRGSVSLTVSVNCFPGISLRMIWPSS